MWCASQHWLHALVILCIPQIIIGHVMSQFGNDSVSILVWEIHQTIAFNTQSWSSMTWMKNGDYFCTPKNLWLRKPPSLLMFFLTMLSHVKGIPDFRKAFLFHPVAGLIWYFEPWHPQRSASASPSSHWKDSLSWMIRILFRGTGLSLTVDASELHSMQDVSLNPIFLDHSSDANARHCILKDVVLSTTNS